MAFQDKIKKNVFSIIFFLYIIPVCILLFLMAFYFIEVNPVKFNNNIEHRFFSFVPQGWAFFTRSPREAQIILYKKNSDNKYEEINQRHANIYNLFGLNRKPSKVLGELQFAKKEIPKKLYYDTIFNYQKNHIIEDVNKLKPFYYENKMYDPILCGDYLVVYQKAVPWAWSKNIDKINMPCKMIKINFICKKNSR